MINHRFLYILTFILVISKAATGYEMGIVGGLNSNSSSTSVAATTIEGFTGFHVGVIGFAELSNQFSIRSGALYAQRGIDVVSGTSTTEARLSYLEVPVTVMYMANESIGLFGGAHLGVKISDSCSVNGVSCNLTNPESISIGAVLGAQFRFIPNIGGEVSYVMGVNKVSDPTVEALSSLMLSAFYLF